MVIKNSILFILLILIKILVSVPSNSYYLIDINTNNISLNTSYCSTILINKDLYNIPNQCHKHILCNTYHCDDKSFRCIKIRETLCCLYKYLEKNCQKEYLKDQFRSIYFHISIQHGYCEINLERIEQSDYSYCIANSYQTKVTSLPRLSLKYYHRLSTRSSYIYQITNKSLKSSFIYRNFIILLLSILFILDK